MSSITPITDPTSDVASRFADTAREALSRRRAELGVVDVQTNVPKSEELRIAPPSRPDPDRIVDIRV